MATDTPAPAVREDPPAPPPSEPLRDSAAAALRWSIIGSIGRQAVRFGFTLVLARLLGPTNFGVVAQALVFLAFIHLFLDQGIGAALIQRKELADDVIGSVFWLNLVTSAVLAVATFLTAPLIADFFRTDELAVVLRVLAVSVLLQGLVVVPRAMVTRRLQFRALAITELTAALISGVVGVAAAVAGAGYWALVVQTLTIDLVVFAGAAVVAGRLPVRGSWEALRGVWSFSTRVFGFSLVNYATRNLDNILVGRYLGPAQLAFYSLSYRTLMLPVQNLSQVANRVALPVYSRIQDDVPRLRRQYLLSNRLIALLAFPLMTLIIVEAPVLVPFFFGPDWEPAVLPMQILALTGLRQSVQSTMGPVLLARNRPDLQLRWGMSASALYVVSFVVGLQGGIVGVAAAYTVVGMCISPIAVRIVGHVLDFRVADFLRTLRPAAVATLVLAAVTLGVRLGLEAVGAPAAVVIVACSAAGIAAYVLVMVRVWPGEVADAREYVKLTAGRGT